MKLLKVFIQSVVALAFVFGTIGVGADEPSMDFGVQANDSTPAIHDAISDWLAVAEPPSNVLFGTNYAYNEWGQLVGQTMSGKPIEATPPTPRSGDGAKSPHQFVWQLRKKLDSVEHCTLEEYVGRVLTNSSIDNCAERYNRTIPDLTAMSALAVENSLAALGLNVRVLPGTLAPNALMVSKVQRQEPHAYNPFEEGDTITVWLFAERDVASQSTDGYTTVSEEE